MSGFIDIHKERDLWEYRAEQGTGSVSTLNRFDNDPPPKRNPIGFIWPKEDDADAPL